MVLLIFGFWLSLILIPITLVVTQTLYHTCPLCYRELGTNNRIFNHFFLEDKVLNKNYFFLKCYNKVIGFKFAQVGLILTRKILLGIALSILLMVILFFKIKVLAHPHSFEKIKYFSDDWPTFLERCSVNKLTLNSAFCVEKYLDRSAMNWEGYVIRLVDNRENFHRFLTHAVELLVKMEPSEAFPDIYLTFDSMEAQEFGSVFNNLERGKKVRFNGTVKNFGESGSRHLHGLSVMEIEGMMKIEESGIGKGRYGAFRGKKKSLEVGQRNKH